MQIINQAVYDSREMRETSCSCVHGLHGKAAAVQVNTSLSNIIKIE